jgi:hypothetical protein
MSPRFELQAISIHEIRRDNRIRERDQIGLIHAPSESTMPKRSASPSVARPAVAFDRERSCEVGQDFLH